MKQERSRRTSGRLDRRGCQGQGTLEYIMLLTVILIALVAVMSTAFDNSVRRMVNQSGVAVNNAATKLMNGLVGL